MKFFLFLISFGFLAIAGIAFYGLKTYQDAGPLMSAKTLVIPKGAGISAISRMLEKEGVIRNAYVFSIALKLQDPHATLKAGEYAFEPQVQMPEIIRKLKAGDIVRRQFTIREGLSSFEIVAILNKTEGLEGVVDQIPAEGSLLAETYQFQLGDTRATKVSEMQSAMTKLLDDLWPKRARDLPFSTPQEALILASIVEKETGKADERPRIAGVFINRLRQGIPLQSDPTVIYAITKGQNKNDGQGPLGRRMLTKDLQIESPYNTYKVQGLPPTAIANPGRAAIEAVLNPEQNEFLYFVADGTGGHVFAKTLAEHNKNVQDWRKIRRQNGN